MEDEVETPDFDSDMTATMAEIESRPTEAASVPEVSEPEAPEAAEPAAASPPLEAWRALPKSWAKDMESHYGSLPPEVQQYVHKRDQDYLNGIMEYKTPLDTWNKTVEPFKPVFDHYNINPQEAFSRLANAHLTLKFGDPEQRAALAQEVIKDYNLAEYMGQGTGEAAQPNPLNDQVRGLQARLDAYEGGQQREAAAKTKQEVESFFSDPAHEFSREVVTDMIDLVKSGAAPDLKAAYERAIWTNPEVRQKLVEREAAKIAKPPAAPRNVRSSSVPPAPTGSGNESIEETLQQTLAKINSR